MAEATTIGTMAGERMRATTDTLLAETGHMPAALITWIPGEGVWSVMDNLCHIREFIPFWTDEVRRIIANPTDLWGRDHTDVDRLTAVANTTSQDVNAVLHDIDAAVSASAAALKALSDSALATEATSRNPRWGIKPASFVVEHLMVQHLDKHLGQIRRNVAQYTATAGA